MRCAIFRSRSTGWTSPPAPSPPRVEEQNAATSEISRNTTLTAEQTRSITQAITDVSKSVSGTDQAARQVEEYSTLMRGRFEEMRREVQAFVARIRAA
jgi:methyl-accepting chemotaxis protein